MRQIEKIVGSNVNNLLKTGNVRESRGERKPIYKVVENVVYEVVPQSTVNGIINGRLTISSSHMILNSGLHVILQKTVILCVYYFAGEATHKDFCTRSDKLLKYESRLST